MTLRGRCLCQIADIKIGLFIHSACASFLCRLARAGAGSTYVPARLGRGCTNTLPSTTLTRNVGTFALKGSGAEPFCGWYWYPYHGQVMQPSLIRPSPSAPF